MSKRKNNIIVIVSLILLLLIVAFLLFYNKNVGLKEVDYNKVNEMMENKESFVLCISRTTCEHCNSFKPKLKKVAKDNNIIIYYIDIDKESEENQKKFSDIINFKNATPTTVFIKDGTEGTTANRLSGDVSEKKILEKLKVNGFID